MKATAKKYRGSSPSGLGGGTAGGEESSNLHSLQVQFRDRIDMDDHAPWERRIQPSWNLSAALRVEAASMTFAGDGGC